MSEGTPTYLVDNYEGRPMYLTNPEALRDVAVATRVKPGLWYGPIGGISTDAAETNELRAAPLYWPGGVIDAIGIAVTTGAATSTVRLGIYADDGTGYPGALILDAGTVNSTTTGHKEIVLSTPILLPAGLYWLVGVAQGGAPTVRSISQSAVFPVGNTTTAGTHNGASYLQAGVTGALPAAFTTTVAASNEPSLRVMVRAA